MYKIVLVVLSGILLAGLCDGNPPPYRNRYGDYGEMYDSYERYDPYSSYEYGRYYHRRSFLEDVGANLYAIFRPVIRAANDYIVDPVWEHLEYRMQKPAEDLERLFFDTEQELGSIWRSVERIFTRGSFLDRIQLNGTISEERKEVQKITSRLREMEDDIKNKAVEPSGVVEVFLQDLIKQAKGELVGTIGNVETNLFHKISKLETISARTREMLLGQLDKLSSITSDFFEKIEEFNSQLVGKGTIGKKFDRKDPYDQRNYNSSYYDY